ncbi:MAG: glutathione peroxidase [Hahellaceae bacterium]|nr:glutathione peroxidase [Hahellaceae bacterium]
MSSIYDISVKNIKGQDEKLEKYHGKVLLIVNTASKCGFTPQFEGLEGLYEKYNEAGLEVLGFPCNQFMSQDPASNDEISQFCSLNYGVTFPMYAKIDVNGESAHPLYKFLKSQAKGFLGMDFVKWNFTKFLVNREGEVVKRFAPTDDPKKIEKDIVALLKA